MSTEIIFIIVGIFVLCAYLYNVHEAGKRAVVYFGYNWDIHLAKKESGKKKTLNVQSLEARRFLMNYYKLLGAGATAYHDLASEFNYEGIEISGFSDRDWEAAYRYAKAGKHYAPLNDEQAPAVIWVYAVIVVLVDLGEGWEIKSIDQSGWSEVDVESAFV